MSKSFKIICPHCEKEAELIILKYLDDEYKKDYTVELKDASERLPPEMTKKAYKLVSHLIRNNVASSIIPTISRIKSHKIGLFKDRCIISERTFKILIYLFMDHEKQIAGFTFHIASEVKQGDII